MKVKGNFFVSIALVLVIAFVFPQSSSLVKGQTELILEPGDMFEIPAYNSTISFAVNGTCSEANLKNDSWTFINIVLNNSVSRQKLNLTVSARDSNVTITSYQKTNSTFAGSPASTVRLRYVVFGQGSQALNLHLNPTEGDYSVISDTVWLGLFDGWSISTDSTITITGERRNVTIAYYGVPETFKNFSTQPFYQQHSIIIIASVILAIIVVLTVAFRITNTKQTEKALEKTSKSSNKDSTHTNGKENKDGIRKL